MGPSTSHGRSQITAEEMRDALRNFDRFEPYTLGDDMARVAREQQQQLHNARVTKERTNDTDSSMDMQALRHFLKIKIISDDTAGSSRIFGDRICLHWHGYSKHDTNMSIGRDTNLCIDIGRGR